MTKLTDFQEIVGLALDISDEQASQMKKAWPESERQLLNALKLWRTVTTAAISGLDLLQASSVIWERRPTDLATAEGRTILYHPVNGSPINEGAPLDGLPVEVLAFLKWSLDKRLLKWTDEVIIAREVKGAGSLIVELPDDRFYGKHSLPYTSGGKIDWSDLALAKAKDFVTNGPGETISTLSVSSTYIGDDTLEGILCSIPGLRDVGTRNRLLNGIPRGPAGCISRSSAYGIDIANLVEAVEGFGKLSNDKWAINILIENAMLMARGTKAAGQLAAFKK